VSCCWFHEFRACSLDRCVCFRVSPLVSAISGSAVRVFPVQETLTKSFPLLNFFSSGITHSCRFDLPLVFSLVSAPWNSRRVQVGERHLRLFPARFSRAAHEDRLSSFASAWRFRLCVKSTRSVVRCCISSPLVSVSTGGGV
jgi:hypothetical protein